MKQILLFLLITSLVGCQKKDANLALPTADGLYRTWKLVNSTRDGKPVPPEQYITTVTFPRDGNFRDSKAKDSVAWCCSPVAFEGTDQTIRFIWDTSDPTCALINCALSPLTGGMTWQITTLNNDALVLTGGNTVLIFDAQR